MKPWKIQKFFGDIVYDLRNRGLLPVVILLVVGMIAVPLVISRGGSTSPDPGPVQAANPSELAPENMQAVVAYNPGLRSYKDRLAEADPKNPFRQQHTESADSAAASELNSTVTGLPEPVSSGTSTGAAPSTGSGGGSTGGGSGGSGKRKVVYFYYAVDVNVSEVGGPENHLKKVRPMDLLPSQVVPVFTYLGSTNGKVAIFSVSNTADQVTGDGTCSPSPADCALLYLRAGQAEQLIYGLDGKTYRLKLNKLNLVRGRP